MQLLFFLLIFIIFFVGCDPPPALDHEREPIPSVSATDNYIFIGDEILNKDYIIRIAAPINRTLFSARELKGYGLDIILNYSTASGLILAHVWFIEDEKLLRSTAAEGLLGSNHTATRIRVFYGTKPECLILKEQIVELLD